MNLRPLTQNSKGGRSVYKQAISLNHSSHQNIMSPKNGIEKENPYKDDVQLMNLKLQNMNNTFTATTVNKKLSTPYKNDFINRSKFTVENFMKDKSLSNEHTRMFNKIDNLLEEQVVKFEMNPNKDHSIFT